MSRLPRSSGRAVGTASRVAAVGFLRRRGPELLLALLACLVFSNSFPGAFLLDDPVIVRDNPLVARFDPGSAFVTDYWGENYNSGLYRPVTILSLALNRRLLGDAPWSYHAGNLALHALASILVYLALRRWGVPAPVGWWAGALFAVHPIHAEVVNEAVGRSEVLVAFLVLLALHQAAGKGRGAFVRSLAAYAAALLAKEHAVAFLAVLPLTALFFAADRRGEARRLAPRFAALTAVTAGWLALRAVVRGMSTVPPDALDPTYVPLAFLAPEARVLTALKLQLVYLAKLLWPASLRGIYIGEDMFTPVVTVSSGWGVLVLASVVLGAALAWHGWQSRGLHGLAIPLYAASVAPTANILLVTQVTFAERLAYFPSVWFCLLVAAPIGAACGRSRVRRRLSVVVSAAAVALAARTLARNPDYGDPVRFWRKDVVANPANVAAWMLLADALDKAGSAGDAAQAYLEMEEAGPAFAEGLYRHAAFLLAQGQVAEAGKRAERAVRAARGIHAPAALVLAQALARTGRPAAALRELEPIAPVYSRYGAYWETRGLALEALGERQAALESYRRARQVGVPRASDIPARMAGLLMELRRYREAEELWRDDARTRGLAASWNGLGVSLALQGREEEALPAFSRALELAPDASEYRANAERARRALGATSPRSEAEPAGDRAGR